MPSNNGNNNKNLNASNRNSGAVDRKQMRAQKLKAKQNAKKKVYRAPNSGKFEHLKKFLASYRKNEAAYNRIMNQKMLQEMAQRNNQPKPEPVNKQAETVIEQVNQPESEIKNENDLVIEDPKPKEEPQANEEPQQTLEDVIKENDADDLHLDDIEVSEADLADPSLDDEIEKLEQQMKKEEEQKANGIDPETVEEPDDPEFTKEVNELMKETDVKLEGAALEEALQSLNKEVEDEMKDSDTDVIEEKDPVLEEELNHLEEEIKKEEEEQKSTEKFEPIVDERIENKEKVEIKLDQITEIKVEEPKEPTLADKVELAPNNTNDPTETKVIENAVPVNGADEDILEKEPSQEALKLRDAERNLNFVNRRLTYLDYLKTVPQDTKFGSFNPPSPSKAPKLSREQEILQLQKEKADIEKEIADLIPHVPEDERLPATMTYKDTPIKVEFKTRRRDREENKQLSAIRNKARRFLFTNVRGSLKGRLEIVNEKVVLKPIEFKNKLSEKTTKLSNNGPIVEFDNEGASLYKVAEVSLNENENEKVQMVYVKDFEKQVARSIGNEMINKQVVSQISPILKAAGVKEPSEDLVYRIHDYCKSTMRDAPNMGGDQFVVSKVATVFFEEAYDCILNDENMSNLSAKDQIIAAQRISNLMLRNYSPLAFVSGELDKFADSYVTRNSELLKNVLVEKSNLEQGEIESLANELQENPVNDLKVVPERDRTEKPIHLPTYYKQFSDRLKDENYTDLVKKHISGILRGSRIAKGDEADNLADKIFSDCKDVFEYNFHPDLLLPDSNGFVNDSLSGTVQTVFKNSYDWILDSGASTVDAIVNAQIITDVILKNYSPVAFAKGTMNDFADNFVVSDKDFFAQTLTVLGLSEEDAAEILDKDIMAEIEAVLNRDERDLSEQDENEEELQNDVNDKENDAEQEPDLAETIVDEQKIVAEEKKSIEQPQTIIEEIRPAEQPEPIVDEQIENKENVDIKFDQITEIKVEEQRKPTLADDFEFARKNSNESEVIKIVEDLPENIIFENTEKKQVNTEPKKLDTHELFRTIENNLNKTKTENNTVIEPKPKEEPKSVYSAPPIPGMNSNVKQENTNAEPKLTEEERRAKELDFAKAEIKRLKNIRTGTTQDRSDRVKLINYYQGIVDKYKSPEEMLKESIEIAEKARREAKEREERAQELKELENTGINDIIEDEVAADEQKAPDSTLINDADAETVDIPDFHNQLENRMGTDKVVQDVRSEMTSIIKEAGINDEQQASDIAELTYMVVIEGIKSAYSRDVAIPKMRDVAESCFQNADYALRNNDTGLGLKDRLIAAQKITDVVLKNYSLIPFADHKLDSYADSYMIKNDELIKNHLRFEKVSNEEIEPMLQDIRATLAGAPVNKQAEPLPNDAPNVNNTQENKAPQVNNDSKPQLGNPIIAAFDDNDFIDSSKPDEFERKLEERAKKEHRILNPFDDDDFIDSSKPDAFELKLAEQAKKNEAKKTDPVVNEKKETEAVVKDEKDAKPVVNDGKETKPVSDEARAAVYKEKLKAYNNMYKLSINSDAFAASVIDASALMKSGDKQKMADGQKILGDLFKDTLKKAFDVEKDQAYNDHRLPEYVEIIKSTNELMRSAMYGFTDMYHDPKSKGLFDATAFGGLNADDMAKLTAGDSLWSKDQKSNEAWDIQFKEAENIANTWLAEDRPYEKMISEMKALIAENKKGIVSRKEALDKFIAAEWMLVNNEKMMIEDPEDPLNPIPNWGNRYWKALTEARDALGIDKHTSMREMIQNDYAALAKAVGSATYNKTQIQQYILDPDVRELADSMDVQKEQFATQSARFGLIDNSKDKQKDDFVMTADRVQITVEEQNQFAIMKNEPKIFSNLVIEKAAEITITGHNQER